MFKLDFFCLVCFARTLRRSDIDFAISTMLESFIQSQKHAVATSLGRRFGRYRALAASPDEFLESVLVDLLRYDADASASCSPLRKQVFFYAVFSRKAREALRQRYHGHIPATLDTEAIEVMESAQVYLLEWMTVVKTLYALPDVAVTRFSESPRFTQKFLLEVRCFLFFTPRVLAFFATFFNRKSRTAPKDHLPSLSVGDPLVGCLLLALLKLSQFSVFFSKCLNAPQPPSSDPRGAVSDEGVICTTSNL